MNEAEYRKDEAKYLKLIAEAMGYKSTISRARNCFIGRPYHEESQTMFSPEHNAEQRWELLEWVVSKLDEKKWVKEPSFLLEYPKVKAVFMAKDRPLALILAALELINAD